ncbi:MAG: hypothetical protein M1825_004293, partial [Sarcosagium campestre]
MNAEEKDKYIAAYRELATGLVNPGPLGGREAVERDIPSYFNLAFYRRLYHASFSIGLKRLSKANPTADKVANVYNGTFNRRLSDDDAEDAASPHAEDREAEPSPADPEPEPENENENESPSEPEIPESPEPAASPSPTEPAASLTENLEITEHLDIAEPVDHDDKADGRLLRLCEACEALVERSVEARIHRYQAAREAVERQALIRIIYRLEPQDSLDDDSPNDSLDDNSPGRVNDEGTLEDAILNFSISLIRAFLKGDKFRSPLFLFTAVLGIDTETYTLQIPVLYTYKLAGLVYVARVFLA